MIEIRSVFITLVLGGSAASAIWLLRVPSMSSPVPAQVVGREFKIAAVETGRLAAILVAPGHLCAGA
jgi:hypothetical protein